MTLSIKIRNNFYSIVCVLAVNGQLWKCWKPACFHYACLIRCVLVERIFSMSMKAIRLVCNFSTSNLPVRYNVWNRQAQGLECKITKRNRIYRSNCTFRDNSPFVHTGCMSYGRRMPHCYEIDAKFPSEWPWLGWHWIHVSFISNRVYKFKFIFSLIQNNDCSFAIGATGKVYEGRGFNRVGAHAPLYNNKSIGICLIGDWRCMIVE